MKKLEKNNLPILSSIKKKGNFKVPDGYFENLPDLLMQIPKEQKKSKIRVLKTWISFSSAIAAMLIIGFFSMHFLQQDADLHLFNKSFAKLTAESFDHDYIQEELELYIDFNDEEELDVLLQEIDSPIVRIEMTNEDFIDFFESDIEYYY